MLAYQASPAALEFLRQPSTWGRSRSRSRWCPEPPSCEVDWSECGNVQQAVLPNLFWWVNRSDDLCGCYFSELLPDGDRRSFVLYEYERVVTEEFGRGGDVNILI
jgi:hypothetical protein